MALLPGSPAINAGDTASAPATDQRGFPRPVGAAADIGAYEFGSPGYLQVTGRTATALDILITGVPERFYWLQTSTNLANCSGIATNQLSPAGTALFQLTPQNEAQRYFRLELP